MNINELCKFIQQSGFEIALLPDPQTGGVKFIARHWYGGKNDQLLMDVNHVTPDLIEKADAALQMFLNRINHEYQLLKPNSNEPQQH